MQKFPGMEVPTRSAVDSTFRVPGRPGCSFLRVFIGLRMTQWLWYEMLGVLKIGLP